ncbi:15445_t:CDS:2 [Funneliformis mosseae]|uniref:15445_t:CDS:1 n=1 Tax=Funneliformis mosseae TaxID=27381 RepID=A0A9N8ZPK4_FUNMO|nr:15445_t:CDS:2 [Funneliformis mosseae]
MPNPLDPILSRLCLNNIDQEYPQLYAFSHIGTSKVIALCEHRNVVTSPSELHGAANFGIF